MEYTARSDATHEPSTALEGAEPRAGRGRGAWTRLALFVVIAVVALGAVVAASRAMPAPERVAFDAHTVRRLRKQAPDFVLLGNSMVHSRFHEPTLKRMLAPRRVSVLGVPGSKSAAWYLMLKNQIFAASQPKRVLIFFYGPELTEPRARALGGEHWRLELVSREEDPVVTRKLAPSWRDPVSRLAWQLGLLVPVERLRGRSSGPIDQWATKVSEWVHPNPDVEARKTAINDLFELDNLRTASEAHARELDVNVRTIEAEQRPFNKLAKSSFLPDILALSKKAGAELTFIHIRLREVAEGEQPPPVYKRYLEQLERYLRARGAGFIDMGPNEWEDIDFYGEGSHIKLPARRKYTRLFVNNMAFLFE